MPVGLFRASMATHSVEATKQRDSASRRTGGVGPLRRAKVAVEKKKKLLRPQNNYPRANRPLLFLEWAVRPQDGKKIRRWLNPRDPHLDIFAFFHPPITGATTTTSTAFSRHHTLYSKLYSKLSPKLYPKLRLKYHRLC